MPEHADVSENIGGTVIQRSFVASGIPRVIHIASVPACDLGVADLSLEEIVAETLGVPYSSALTAEKYATQGIRTRQDASYGSFDRSQRYRGKTTEPA
jgi:hypothetical protein